MTPLVLRSNAARVGGWAWMVFAALNLLDIVFRGRDLAAVVAAAVLILGCGLAYVYCLRPRISAGETGVGVRNPWRDIRVPWPALQKVEATDAITVHFTGADQAETSARAWVLQSSPRARAREERRARRARARLPHDIAKQAAERTPTQYAVQQLKELAAAQRPKRGKTKVALDEVAATGSITWSRTAFAAVITPAAFLLIVIVIAVLN